MFTLLELGSSRPEYDSHAARGQRAEQGHARKLPAERRPYQRGKCDEAPHRNTARASATIEVRRYVTRAHGAQHELMRNPFARAKHPLRGDG